MSKFVIEDSVPLVRANRPRTLDGLTGTFRKMQAGQSFMLRSGEFKHVSTFYSAAKVAQTKIAIRKVDGGIRIWRIA
jgi:hypothetical protein